MNLPTWDCESSEGLRAYEQGLVCGACKKRFGTVLIISNGSPHQWVDSATCSECFKKAIEKRLEYQHAPAMLQWLNGRES